MPEILSTNLKSDLNRLFLEQSRASEDYYLFVSSIGPFDPSDSLFSKNEFLEKTLFAKKISSNDMHYMIKYYPWQKGLVFEEYDDQVDLTGVKFYAVVGPNDNDTGDYRVYKCLNNNDRTEVSNPPNWAETTPNQIYETAEGYVWKFMYKLTDLQFEAYNAVGYIPLVDDYVIDPPTSTGSQVSDILVVNPNDNFGYKEERGALVGSPYSTGIIIVDPSTVVSPTTNYYTGQYLITTNPDGVTTRIFKITYYFYNKNTGNAQIRVGGELITGAANPVAAGVTQNASWKILPEVKIEGDGTGAIGIPNIVDSQIRSIQLIEPGTGYHNITITVTDPRVDFRPGQSGSDEVRCILRARLTPDGGHGYNFIDEFKCKHFMLYAYITADDNTQIGDSNTYTGVGIVKEPTFHDTTPVIFDNRIAITTDDIDKVSANTVLTQLSSGNIVTFSGVVHEVDEDNNTFYLAEYMGPYPNNPATGDGDTSLDLTLPLRNITGQTITINSPVEDNIVMSNYQQRSGEVYFMENFFPLARTDLSREEFKFVLEL
jgi:hypothetical protein